MPQSFRKEVLEQLQRMGSDVTQPHRFDFFLYAPTEVAANAAAKKLRESEFATELSRSASGNAWRCKASVTITPDTAPLDAIGNFFEQIAVTIRGEFDGWESDVVRPKAS